VHLLSNLVADRPEFVELIKDKADKMGIKYDPSEKPNMAFAALRPDEKKHYKPRNLKSTRNKRSLSNPPGKISRDRMRREGKLPSNNISSSSSNDLPYTSTSAPLIQSEHKNYVNPYASTPSHRQEKSKHKK